MGFFRGKLTAVLLIFEILFVILFAVFVRYDPHVAAPGAKDDEDFYPVDKYYGLFQDVHVMMFIGFGFLMTFLKRYGYGSVGFNFLLAAFVIQWSTLFRGFLELEHGEIYVNIQTMLFADFTSAAILISFGALLGKASPLQLIIMAFFEVICAIGNEHIGVNMLGTVDIGGSMYVHTFGAYFGIAASCVVSSKAAKDHPKEGATYTSDLFSMIGTIFLWVFWPSFNSALGDYDTRHRAILNTYFSLAACCVTTFAITTLLNKKGKVEMVHIQNATLAGGVAVGTAADLMIQPWGAILLGIVAGILSTFGFKIIQPALLKLGIHDTCGVNNLHGMPGILGGLGGVVASALATTAVYGDSLKEIFSDRFDPDMVTPGPDGDEIRSAGTQALFQLAALAITIVIAIITGLITGLIMKLPFLDAPSDEELYEDDPFWDDIEREDLGQPTVHNGKEADARV
ncbi:ammonium transporter Rh type B-A-like [Diadema setosum]|uniref:ammonium transporter Rh type B-A-like n=1 Tax=Diadema setosum TaxID=31175 RepID=UPI003B3ACA0E